jgi:hypothetical protein
MGLGNFSQFIIGRDVNIVMASTTDWPCYDFSRTRSFSLLQDPNRFWGLLSFLLNWYRGSLISNFFITYLIYKNCSKGDCPCCAKLPTLWYRSTNWLEYLCTGISGVPREGVWAVQPPSKFQNFDKAEPNSLFRGKYICNNLMRI